MWAPDQVVTKPPKAKVDRQGFQVELVAMQQDVGQKRTRTVDTNSSTKRRPMKVKVGDKVLLKQYPKPRKFEPVYGKEVATVVMVEERGVVVEDANGTTKRRHKDDVKLFHEAPSPSWGESEDHGSAAPVANDDSSADAGDGELATSTAQDGELDTPRTPAPGRPRRERNLPVRLKDYVLRRVAELKGGD